MNTALSETCPNCDGKGELYEWSFDNRIWVTCSYCQGVGKRLTEAGEDLYEALKIMRLRECGK